MFKPREMNDYNAELIISAVDDIKWKFPIKGIAQCLIAD